MTSPLAHWLLCIFVRQVEEIILTFSKILFLNKSHHVTTFDGWLKSHVTSRLAHWLLLHDSTCVKLRKWFRHFERVWSDFLNKFDHVTASHRLIESRDRQLIGGFKSTNIRISLETTLKVNIIFFWKNWQITWPPADWWLGFGAKFDSWWRD